MKIRKLIPKSVLISSSFLFLISCERCYELWPETDRQFGWAYDLPDASMIRRNADTENKRYSISFHGGKKEDGSESFLNIGTPGKTNDLWGIAYVKDGEATWILNKQDNHFTGGELLLDTGERIEGDYKLYDGMSTYPIRIARKTLGKRGMTLITGIFTSIMSEVFLLRADSTDANGIGNSGRKIETGNEKKTAEAAFLPI